MPSGNECGANQFWLSGGMTSGCVNEAVMDFSKLSNFKEIILIKIMTGYKTTEGKYPNRPTDSENEFFKNGWSVSKESDKFYLKYISGSIQGELKIAEISEKDFELAKVDGITLDQLCVKYNIF